MRGLKFEKPDVVEKKLDVEGFSSVYHIKPLARGYGLTLGNALRRVLLSSLPGAAIVNMKIDGVEHEFSTIKGVKEDVMKVILNLKKVIFKVDSDDDDFEQKLSIHQVGPIIIRAEHFNQVTGIEVVNSDQEIATLAAGETFELEVTVRRGVGYINAEKNKAYSKHEKSVIAIDALYAPVSRVSYVVEKTRNDNDELILTIDTNGAITVKDAIADAAKKLVDYFTVIAEESEKAALTNNIHEQKEEPTNKKLEMKIEQLDLSVRLFNSLKRQGIYTVGQIVNQTEEEVMRFRSLGRKSFKELREKLLENGLEFKNSSKESSYNFDDEDGFQED